MNVFILSMRAGGLRINLISADTCIMYDSDWEMYYSIFLESLKRNSADLVFL